MNGKSPSRNRAAAVTAAAIRRPGATLAYFSILCISKSLRFFAGPLYPQSIKGGSERERCLALPNALSASV